MNLTFLCLGLERERLEEFCSTMLYCNFVSIVTFVNNKLWNNQEVKFELHPV